MNNGNFSLLTFEEYFDDFADGVLCAFSFFNLTIDSPQLVCTYLPNASNQDHFISAIYFLTYSDEAQTIRDHLSLSTFPTLVHYRITTNNPSSPIDQSFFQLFSMQRIIDGSGSVETSTHVESAVKSECCETYGPTVLPTRSPMTVINLPTTSPSRAPIDESTGVPSISPTVEPQENVKIIVKRKWTPEAVGLVCGLSAFGFMMLCCLLQYYVFKKDKNRNNRDNANDCERKNLKMNTLQDHRNSDNDKNDDSPYDRLEGQELDADPLRHEKANPERKSEQEREKDNNKA